MTRLSGFMRFDYTLARHGADKLWHLLHTEDYVPSLGAMTGNQAMQMVRAGLKAIDLSGWQVAADSNTAGGMYPDQSLYPANSGPVLASRINRTLQRADQIQTLEGTGDEGRGDEDTGNIDWFAPIVADAEAGFGGALNAFEQTRNYIEAGVAGFHALNYATYELSRGYRARGMSACSELQNAEFAAETNGYTAHRNQREVGAGWFDAVSMAVSAGNSSTTALDDSTEEAQFNMAAAE